jgi:hypothetical protein
MNIYKESRRNIMEEPTTKQTKNRTPWIIGTILVMLLLVGAAFVGGNLLNKQAAGLSDNVFEVDFTEAEEIPQSKPEAAGIVTEIDGNTLTIQEFNINDTLGTSGEGGVFMEPIEIEVDNPEDLEELPLPAFMGADGPITEVVVTRDTKIYRDVTFSEVLVVSDGGELPEIPENIEMKVEPAAADEIGTNSMVTIWGERRGDRVVADVILFQPPPSMPEIDFGSP